MAEPSFEFQASYDDAMIEHAGGIPTNAANPPGGRALLARLPVISA